ncbi:MAG: DUF1573 domain-containing protein [Marinifilaceae bacterium]
MAVLCMVLTTQSCKERTEKTEHLQPTEMEFEHKTFDFGNITEGETVLHTFTFKNTGNNKLRINNVETTCGCTTVEFPEKAIAPGKTGKIEVAFNSSGRYGKQYKEIRIFANIPKGYQTLRLVASIK